jgi:hypothetical protein
MSITVYEGEPSRDFVSGGDSPQIVLNYIVLGTRDENAANAAVRNVAPLVCDGLIFRSISGKEVAPEAWECQAHYGARKPPAAGDYKFAFDTTGGKQKITQSLETLGNHAPAGKTAPSYGGAIGVTDHGVEGCEIVVPKFAWSETHQLPIATYGWAYSQKLKSITGRVNGWRFRGFPAGQVLFHGARGSASAKDPALIEITFNFEQSDDVKQQTVGSITGIDKPGWAYLWVRYGEVHDTSAKKLVKRPESAHVERVYYAGNFNVMGIGS